MESDDTKKAEEEIEIIHDYGFYGQVQKLDLIELQPLYAMESFRE